MRYIEFLIYWIFSSSSKLSVKINQEETLAFIEALLSFYHVQSAGEGALAVLPS